MIKSLRYLIVLTFVAAFSQIASAAGLVLDEDDDAISLSPVKKGLNKEIPTVEPTAVPSDQPSAVPTAVPPTAVPTPIPKPTARPSTLIEDLGYQQVEEGVRISVRAMKSLRGKASVLKNPDRVLVKLPNTRMFEKALSRDINLGSVVKARMSAHPGNETWLVIDLLEPVAFEGKSAANGYSLLIKSGAPKPAAVSYKRTADLPRINLMFFDLNVMYQGRQYDRFPCANFIYDKTDTFPLKRDFITTLVFHQGYGAFVGNLRLVDPKGNVIDHTKDPVAFNLFNELFDYSVEVPWKVEFPAKGFYSLILTLNGEDVLEHRFYVGHNDDKPEAVKK